MIVTCERCETQFQLDERRVPDQGARVRCSRCKHAFVVHRPAAGAEEEIHRAADEAARVGETPEPTRDLGDPGEVSGADWQFNVDGDPDEGVVADPPAADPPDEIAPPETDGTPEADPLLADAPPAEDFDAGSDFGAVEPGDSLSLDDDAAATDDAPLLVDGERTEDEPLFGDSLEADSELPAGPVATVAADPLGSSDDWDLFDDPAAAAEPAASAPAVAIASDAPSEAPFEVPASPLRGGLREELPRRAAGAAGWLAMAGLLAVGLARGLAPLPETSLSETASGVAVEELSGRWVENARLGRIYVVSGLVRASAAAPAPALALVLRDASGRALEPALPLSLPVPLRTLREGGAEELRRRPSSLARPLRSGEARRFETVVWPLPAEAERFEVVAGR